jgi:hypothetical protein
LEVNGLATELHGDISQYAQYLIHMRVFPCEDPIAVIRRTRPREQHATLPYKERKKRNERAVVACGNGREDPGKPGYIVSDRTGVGLPPGKRPGPAGFPHRFRHIRDVIDDVSGDPVLDDIGQGADAEADHRRAGGQRLSCDQR